MRNYHGHSDRAAWSLLGYELKYRSFIKRKGAWRGSPILEEEEDRGEQVTLAIIVGQRIESGDRASTSCSASEPAETSTVAAKAETSSRRGGKSQVLLTRRKKKKKRWG